MSIKKLNNYLNERITNSWYKNAALDYGVTGRFISAEAAGSDLVIRYEEEGQQRETVITWYTEYSPEEIYNIWMEAA